MLHLSDELKREVERNQEVIPTSELRKDPTAANRRRRIEEHQERKRRKDQEWFNL